MNDELTTDDTSSERDDDWDRGGEQATDESPQVGITDEDMEQIRSFLAKQRHHRSVDDLRPSSKR